MPYSRIYKFNEDGMLLQVISEKTDGKIIQTLKVESKDRLVYQITNIPSNPDLKRVYNFFYDKNRRLIAQSSTTQEDTIKFSYDEMGRLTRITNYYERNLIRLYDDNGSIAEEQLTWNNMSGHYSKTNYIREKDKVIEKQTFTTSKGAYVNIIVKDYDGPKLMRETVNSDSDSQSFTTDYEYSNSGFLSLKKTETTTTSFEVVLPEKPLSPDTVNRINRILLGDYTSIGWY